MGSDLQLGPGGFSTPFLCRRDGSGAGEGASSQAHVSTEPGQGKQTAPEAFVASSEGKSAGNHSWSQGWEGATGPGPSCKSKPRARDMPGPHGPCPASSKLTVVSKRPPRHTHTQSGFVSRALAKPPLGCFHDDAQAQSLASAPACQQRAAISPVISPAISPASTHLREEVELRGGTERAGARPRGCSALGTGARRILRGATRPSSATRP